MLGVFRQSDHAWSLDPLGFGAKGQTLGSHGCLVAAVAQAAAMAGTRPEATPKSVNTLLQMLGGFTGAKLHWQQALRLHGFQVLDDEVRAPACDPRLALRLSDKLHTPGRTFALVNVDHDASRPGGDDEPDHWLLAYRLGHTPGGVPAVWCTDSAIGQHVPIPLATLAQQVTWRAASKGRAEDRRLYQVCWVRPFSVA
jgi:hypothetical protein